MRPTGPALFLVLAAGIAMAASPVDTSYPTFAGPVNFTPVISASAASGDTLFLAGFMRWVGPLTGGGVPVSATDLVPLAGFPHVNGSVYAATSDGAGGWYIGGSFTYVGGLPRANLAHVLSDLTVDTWAPSTNGEVIAIVATPDQVCVAGRFTTVNGTPSNGFSGVARADGAIVMMPPMGGLTAALATDGANVYLGGEFTTANGVPRSRLAAFRLSDHNLTSWAPDANGGVYALRSANGYVYAGGDFTTILGQPRSGAAALDPVSGQPSPWNPQAGAPGGVRALLAVGDRVYLGGFFTQVGGVSRGCLAAVDTASGALTSWDPQAVKPSSVSPAPIVYSLEAAGGDVLAGGTFEQVGAQARSCLVRLDAVTGEPLPAPETPGSVRALVASGPNVLVGGGFSTLGGGRRGDLAAVRISTGEVLPWAPNATRLGCESVFGNIFCHYSNLTAVAVDADRVYAAMRSFESFDYLASVHAYSRTAGAELWARVFRRVNALAVMDTVLFVGGAFDTPGRAVIPLHGVTGVEIAGWGVAVDATAYALQVTPAGLAVGGEFTSIGGQPRHDLAMLDLSTGLATAWAPEPDGPVRSFALAGSALFCGGDFSHVGSEARARLAALTLDTGAPLAWNPGADTTVRSLALHQGVLYAGGSFSTIGGQPRTRVATLDPSTGATLPLDAQILPGRDVFSVTPVAGRLFISGSQFSAGSEPTWGLTVVPAEDPLLGVEPGGLIGRASLRVEPQPARTIARVSLTLPRATDVEVGLYDVSGRRLAVLAPRGHRPAGELTLSLEARRLRPGVYLVRASTAEGDITRKLVALP